MSMMFRGWGSYRTFYVKCFAYVRMAVCTVLHFGSRKFSSSTSYSPVRCVNVSASVNVSSMGNVLSAQWWNTSLSEVLLTLADTMAYMWSNWLWRCV